MWHEECSMSSANARTKGMFRSFSYFFFSSHVFFCGYLRTPNVLFIYFVFVYFYVLWVFTYQQSQPELVKVIEKHLRPGGMFFMQSDYFPIVEEMRTLTREAAGELLADGALAGSANCLLAPANFVYC